MEWIPGAIIAASQCTVNFFGLTMGVNVPQLIVHVEEAPEALWSCGHWPVTCQDIFVEL